MNKGNYSVLSVKATGIVQNIEIYKGKRENCKKPRNRNPFFIEKQESFQQDLQYRSNPRQIPLEAICL